MSRHAGRSWIRTAGGAGKVRHAPPPHRAGALTFAFDLTVWIAGALLTLLAFVSSLKSATECATLRVVHYRKRKRLERLAASAGGLSVRISAYEICFVRPPAITFPARS